MSILNCRNSLRGVGGRRGDGDGGGGDGGGGGRDDGGFPRTLDIWRSLVPTTLRAQEPNIPCGEALTSTIGPPNRDRSEGFPIKNPILILSLIHI